MGNLNVAAPSVSVALRWKTWQIDDFHHLGDPHQRPGHVLSMLLSDLVVVGEDDYGAVSQVFGVLRFPLAGTAGIACGDQSQGG